MSRGIKKIIAGILIVPLVALGVQSISQNVVSAAGGTSDMTLGSGLESSKGTDVPTQLTGTGGMFEVVVNILLFIIGAVSVIMLIYGGIRYTTSGGNANSVTAAKNTIMYAIIGLVVAILAYAIINFVISQMSTN